tara:strand:+ start:351 stop:602 length:252 start_codon:yes stop_codon:yes gene_type:complete
MNIEAYKIRLLKKVLEEKNESTLIKINRILNKEDEIVAYSTSGEPLTKLEYLRQIEKGANDIAEGKILSSVELRNRVNSWTKS